MVLVAVKSGHKTNTKKGMETTIEPRQVTKKTFQLDYKIFKCYSTSQTMTDRMQEIVHNNKT